MANRRELDLNKAAAGALPVVPPTELRNPHEFLNFLRNKVTIEMLLADRYGQARLDYVLDRKFSRKKWDPYIYITDAGKDIHARRPKNHYPYLELEGFPTPRVVRQPFMLKDGNYYYYFPDQEPQEELPPYLRPEDLVPSGFFSAHHRKDEAMSGLGIDERTFFDLRYEFDPALGPYTDYVSRLFKKTVHRMPVTGGTGERYNFNSNQWEESGDIWKPGLRRRAGQLLQSARDALGRRRRSSASTPPAITS